MCHAYFLGLIPPADRSAQPGRRTLAPAGALSSWHSTFNASLTRLRDLVVRDRLKAPSAAVAARVLHPLTKPIHTTAPVHHAGGPSQS